MKTIIITGMVSLLCSLFGTPVAIRILRRQGYGQLIREEGPAAHATKRGTPTMGGTVIVVATVSAATAIQSAVDNLAAHPLVGRRLEGELRELIISYGRSGYVALYRLVIAKDEVRILAIRHQREIGFLP